VRSGGAAVATAAVVLAACGGGGAKAPALALDGSPRHPNAEGVVTEVATDHLVLDGARRFSVATDLRCFSSSTLASVPLVGRKGTYVQVGAAGSVVHWLAAYGAVVQVPGQPAVAYHVGKLVGLASGKATFADGSVLSVAPGVTAPAGASQVRATIDVGAKRISALAGA
jgi:hypothetical protein